MTHDELLAKIDTIEARYTDYPSYLALRAVVELHKPYESKPHKPYSTLYCTECTDYSTANWPCATIQAIEKEWPNE